MPRTVLLIEDNSPTAALVEKALLGSNDGSLPVERIRKCSEAQARLGKDPGCAIAAVVTNLFLPDSQGLETIARIFEVSPHIPILVLTTPDNEHIAQQAMQHGAQDYLLQHRLDSYSLPRIVRNMLYRMANRTAPSTEDPPERIPLKSIDDSLYDYPTGLPNASLLKDRLDRAIASACRSRQSLAVLCVDIDRFKRVNYTLGHAIGDQLLRSIGERLITNVRASDTVSRQCSDEFVVVVPGLSHAEDAALSAEKIATSLSAPHSIERYHLRVPSAIGIAVYPDDGSTATSLVSNARIAMSAAKEQGPNSFVFFQPHLNELAFERRFLESGLRHALDRGKLARQISRVEQLVPSAN